MIVLEASGFTQNGMFAEICKTVVLHNYRSAQGPRKGRARTGNYWLSVKIRIHVLSDWLARKPFFFEAAILSRMRSPVTSRSNCAKDNNTLSVRRPIELVVLNCWVT